jgi:hypothetical protein
MLSDVRKRTASFEGSCPGNNSVKYGALVELHQQGNTPSALKIIWTGAISNQGLRGDRPATNPLTFDEIINI